MANIITADVTSLLTISIKSRHDGFTDQWSRIFMMKIFFVCSMIMGISWFKDSMSCIVPDHTKIDGDFVSAACWIQGLYIYREMEKYIHSAGYWGIPQDIGYDGISPMKQVLCTTLDRQGRPLPVEECRPMDKTFYLQYQFMPYYIACLGALFYVPYLIFVQCNSDLISLKDTLKERVKADKDDDNGDKEEDPKKKGKDDGDEKMTDDQKAEKIVKFYFDTNKQGRLFSMRSKIALNIVCKCLYVLVNVGAFLFTDAILNGNFRKYGIRWLQWTEQNNTMQYEYTGRQVKIRAGDHLLPSFGFCEVNESSMDKLIVKTNKFKFVCELSQNVLYQYCLFIVWVMLIVGIIMSICGLLYLLIHYISSLLVSKRQGVFPQRVYNSLTFREIEYLEYLRKKNIPIYNRVVDELKKSRFANSRLPPNELEMDDVPPPSRVEESAPLYPSDEIKKVPY